MATIDTYKLKIEVDGAEKVEDLKDSLQDVGGAFQKAAAAGVAAFSALSIGAIRLADSIVDLSDATGISAGKIYQLSAATEAAGGKFESGGKMLQAFSRELEGIEKGSETTIEGLKKLGLSRSDLENLSDQQLFSAVVNGLANMDNGFQKTALAMQFFGKEAAGIDFKTLAQELNKTVDPNLDARLRSAADAVRSIEMAYRNLQLAALEAIAPVIQAIGTMNFDIESARKSIQILGALIAGAFAASVVVQIAKVIELIKKLALAIRAAGTAQAFLTGLTGVGLVAVAASAAAATAAYVALGKAMEDAVDSKKELESPVPGVPATPAGQQGSQRQVGQTPAEKQLEAIKASTEQLKIQNQEALKYEQTINGTIGLLDEQAARSKLNADIDRDIANQKANIEKQIASYRSDTSKDNTKIIAELQQQLALVESQGESMRQIKLDALTRAEAEQRTKDALKAQSESDKLKIAQAQDALKAEQMRKVISGEISEEEMANTLALNQIKTDSILKLRDLQAQYDSATSQAEKDRIRQSIDLEKLRAESAVEQKRKELEQKLELEESYAAGAVKALENIAEAFKPYKMAQDAIQKTWSRIGEAVDQFVETGKFKFSDFARSVLQDLAKMIAKAMIFKAINTALGAFGISIPGLASGGPAKANQPYIVGEKGPELFVPKSAGTVIPNKSLTTPTGMSENNKNLSAPITNNYNTYNINALDAKSVAQLFAENRKAIFGANKMAEREMSYAGVR